MKGQVNSHLESSSADMSPVLPAALGPALCAYSVGCFMDANNHWIFELEGNSILLLPDGFFSSRPTFFDPLLYLALW